MLGQLFSLFRWKKFWTFFSSENFYGQNNRLAGRLEKNIEWVKRN